MSAQEDFDLFESIAEKLGLDDDERGSFINSAMKRLGHKARVAWDDAEEGGSGNGGGDFFSRRRESRQVPPGRRDRGDDRRASGGGWQYGS